MQDLVLNGFNGFVSTFVVFLSLLISNQLRPSFDIHLGQNEDICLVQAEYPVSPTVILNPCTKKFFFLLKFLKKFTMKILFAWGKSQLGATIALLTFSMT